MSYGDRLPPQIGRINLYVTGSYDVGAFAAVGNFWTALDTWPAFVPTLYYLAPQHALRTQLRIPRRPPILSP
jgi:hypothetical protein